MEKPITDIDERDTKTVGGSVDVELYWNFKTAAAERKESMQQALNHALLLYVDCVPKEDTGEVE